MPSRKTRHKKPLKKKKSRKYIKKYNGKKYNVKKYNGKKYNGKKYYGKKYKGGVSPYDLTSYTFGTFENMKNDLTRFIEMNEDYYKDTMLDTILKCINEGKTFNDLPGIIQLIMKLEIKPSNVLWLIKSYLNIEPGDSEDKESFDGLLKVLNEFGLLDEPFIDIVRTIPSPEELFTKEPVVVDKSYGWAIISKLLHVIIDALVTILDIDLRELDLSELGLGNYGKNYSYDKENSLIQSSLINHLNNPVSGGGNHKKEPKQSGGVKMALDTFLKGYIYDQVKEDGDPDIDFAQAFEKIDKIEDFFNQATNPVGVLPPVVLFVLTCRINPIINNFKNEKALTHRKTILETMNTVKYCCKTKICINVGTCVEGNCKNNSTVATKPKKNPTTATTCDVTNIPQKVISVFASLFGKDIKKDICPTISAHPIDWATFDPIFELITKFPDVVRDRDYVQRFIFDTIIPYSTFFPLNINAYINEKIYKKKDPLFDKKIAFFEAQLSTKYIGGYNGAYTSPEYKIPICVPNDIMTEIYKEWNEYKKEGESIEKTAANETIRREKALKKSNATLKNPSFFKRIINKTLRRKNKYVPANEGIEELPSTDETNGEDSGSFHSIDNKSPESYHSARSHNSWSSEEEV